MNEQEIETEIKQMTERKADPDRCAKAQRDDSTLRSKLGYHYGNESSDVERALNRFKSTHKWSECVLENWAGRNLEKYLLDLINQTSEAEKYNFDKRDIENYKRSIQDIRSYCYQLQKHLDIRIQEQEKFESQ